VSNKIGLRSNPILVMLDKVQVGYLISHSVVTRTLSILLIIG
jgi:hypothetical protein